MGTVQITERLSPVPFAGGVTVVTEGEYLVARGVVICGLKSANGRDYPADTLRRAVPKYEGKPVFLDHTDSRTGRSVREWFGELRNVRSRPDGRPEGDLCFPASSGFAAEFRERAKDFPRSLGLSHVAQCKTSRKGGREVVEDIDSVESVDLVASPATTTSLKEHREGSAVQISLKTFCERVGSKYGAKTWAGLTKLCEDFGDLADVPALDEPPADAPADAGDLKAALMSAITPMLDAAFESGDAGPVTAALKDFIKLHAKHSGGGGDDKPEPPAEKSEESRKPTLTAVIAECEAAKLPEPPVKLLERLTNIADPDTRKFLIEQQLAVSRTSESARGERPRSAGRHGAEGSGLGKPVKESVAPSSAKEFANSIKG